MSMKRIVLAAAFAAATSSAQAAPMHWAADVPMRDCNGFPCIDAKAGTLSGRALIDTGDIVSIVDNSDAAAVGANLTGATLDARIGKAPVQVGNAQLSDVMFLPVGLKDYIAKHQSPVARLSLTYTAFKDRILQLDFVHHRVRISGELATSQPCDTSCGRISYPTFGKKGPAIVVADGFSVNGKPLTAQIDSVFSGGLLIYDASIDKLGLSRIADTKITQSIPFTDGGVTMKKNGAEAIAFEDQPLASKAAVYFPTPGVHQPDALFDGTVGVALMRGHVVTLNFHDNTLEI